MSDKKEKSGAEKARIIDDIIQSPTEKARSHRHRQTWSNTGTNVSYEGSTAPAGGGSVGTGEASGHSATGASINTTDYEAMNHKSEKEEKEASENNNESPRVEHNRNDETDNVKNR